jgi:hypothetical protein
MPSKRIKITGSLGGYSTNGWIYLHKNDIRFLEAALRQAQDKNCRDAYGVAQRFTQRARRLFGKLLVQRMRARRRPSFFTVEPKLCVTLRKPLRMRSISAVKKMQAY